MINLGTIEVPEPPANVTFGGPEFKTLYITARTSLYRADMEATGHRFARGEK
jgi:gluconolactonase